jgi:UDP-glucose:(heptosyl)LPS alpha-1,3-glucosyltransferase
MPASGAAMTRAPHIAVIRQRYTAFGGAERFLEKALDALVAEGAQLTAIARAWPTQTGVRVLRCNPPYLGRLWRDRSFARCVCARVADGGFDLVQSHERIACCDVYRAGDGVHREWLRQRARVLGPLGWLSQTLSPYHRYVLQAEGRLFASPRLAAVICNSEMVKRELAAHFGYPAERVHVIYSGVDAARFHPGLRAQHRAEVRARHGIAADATLLLFVGSGFLRKGLQPLLVAMASLPPDTYLAIVGKDRQTARYRRLARRLGIDRRVQFLGPQREVAPYYGAADVFVLPTLYDPFPNAVLEAMAAGLPVVTGTKSGASDIVREGENGFICDPLHRAALVDAIRRLLDPAVQRACGQRAHETVLPLTIDRMAQRLLDVYRTIL